METTENTETIDYPRGLTFEIVWAALMEDRKQQAENAKELAETGRLLKEYAKEHKEQMAEYAKERKKNERERKEQEAKNKREMEEYNKRMEDYNKRFGELTNRFGEIVEYMVAPNLRDKFEELGLVFLQSNNGTKVDDHVNNIHFEVDIVLENGDKALLVEVKTKPTIQDVREHVELMEKMRAHADRKGDKRKFMGAVAGVVINENVMKFIHKKGFFAVTPSGQTFIITPPVENKIMEW